MINITPESIPLIIKKVVDRVRANKLAELQAYDPTIQTVNYLYGNIKEVIKRLEEYQQNETLKYQKYPLIILIEDITIQRRNSLFGIANLEMIICNHTKATYTSAEREVINFKNILRILYPELLNQMWGQRGFRIQSRRSIEHDYTERKYWGADDQTANKLGDYIDAIHLTRMQIPIDYPACLTVVNEDI